MRLTPPLRPIKWCVRCLLVLAVSTPAVAVADCTISTLFPERACLQGAQSLVLAQRPPRLASTHTRDIPIAPAMTEDAYLAVNAGFVGLFNRFKETLRYGMEYRWKSLSALKIRPAAGLIMAENDASYLFIGMRRDFNLSPNWVLTGSFDAGYFEERDELNLGLELEFRTGLELAYQFANRYRAGVALYHLSNGGFGERNPGTESAVINLTIPIQ